MAETRPCPFCESKNHPYHKEGCFIINANYTTIEAYNTRPIEDALVKELRTNEQDFRNFAASFPPDSDMRQIAENCAERVRGIIAKAGGEA
jgi:hypothetical protein